jgi:large subunit ribosomal protein L18
MTGLVKVKYKRRRQNKTDYLARKRFLESRMPRIVARKTSRYIIAQLVESKEAQDKTICSVNSKDLIKYGWPKNYSIKNLPASYLTGFLLGKKMAQKGCAKAILDMGLIRSTKGNKIYALLKGVIDSGIDVPHSKDMFPTDSQIKGENLKDIKSIFEKVKGAVEKA